jgi:hypothetical protein
LAVAIPPVTSDCVSIEATLIPEVEGLKLAAARAGDCDCSGRHLGARPGVRSQRNNRAVYFSNASVVFEVLKDCPATEFDGGAVWRAEPHRSSAEPDGELLSGKILHALELVFVKVALSFRYEEVVANLQTEGTRGSGRR